MVLPFSTCEGRQHVLFGRRRQLPHPDAKNRSGSIGQHQRRRTSHFHGSCFSWRPAHVGKSVGLISTAATSRYVPRPGARTATGTFPAIDVSEKGRIPPPSWCHSAGRRSHGPPGPKAARKAQSWRHSSGRADGSRRDVVWTPSAAGGAGESSGQTGSSGIGSRSFRTGRCDREGGSVPAGFGSSHGGADLDGFLNDRVVDVVAAHHARPRICRHWRFLSNAGIPSYGARAISRPPDKRAPVSAAGRRICARRRLPREWAPSELTGQGATEVDGNSPCSWRGRPIQC
jgi:hypothetical protein